MAMADPPGESRRRFLKLATGAVGCGVGAAVLVPAARFIVHPVGESTVTAATAPIDAIAVADVGAEPVRVPMVAHTVRDAWASTRDVALGAAWIRRGPGGKIAVLSSVCPHKGCAIDYAAATQRFECPCHGAIFDVDGQRLRGPAERGLDPLPFTVEGERVKVTWVRFENGGAERKPA
jgi:Rieske Fe-S protein